MLDLLISLQTTLIDIEPIKTQYEAPEVFNEQLRGTSTPEIKAYIKQKAIEYDVNPNVALAVVKCESNFDPKAIGDGGQSKGLWQIHYPSWKLPDSVTLDPYKSTDWAMPKLKETPEIWTCYMKGLTH